MYGIVSLLPEPYQSEASRRMQRALEFGAEPARLPAHVSFHVAAAYPLEETRAALQEIAAQTAPLTVHTGGWGVFPGPQPVVFIAVAKNEALVALHQRIWKRLAAWVPDPHPLYALDAWVPHITIACEGLTPASASRMLASLAFEPLQWHFELPDLTVVCNDPPPVRLRVPLNTI